MAFAYRIHDQPGVYFVTCTVNQWVDVFTRNIYKEIVLDSLRHCQQEKGPLVYAWVIMSNHIHLIISTNKIDLSGILRDFKKYTAKQIFASISTNPYESRKRWLQWLLKENNDIVFWQEGYHGEEITSKEFYRTKENYIHLNPVRAGLVLREEDYIYSSCADRYGIRKGLLELSDFG